MSYPRNAVIIHISLMWSYCGQFDHTYDIIGIRCDVM